MLAYYNKATSGSSEEEGPLVQADIAYRGKLPSYMSLAAQYGDEDDMSIGVSDAGGHKKTAMEEYQDYVTAQLSPRDTDPLKFWEVRGDINGLEYH